MSSWARTKRITDTTELEMKSKAPGVRKKKKRIREGRGIIVQRQGKKKKKDIAQQRELKKENIYIKREQKRQLYDLEEAEGSKKCLDKGDIGEVGMRAMWPDWWSLHPLNRGVIKASRLHVFPAFSPTRRCSENGQVVPAHRAEANYNLTEHAGGKYTKNSKHYFVYNDRKKGLLL